jgi:hypothetical protein
MVVFPDCVGRLIQARVASTTMERLGIHSNCATEIVELLVVVH